jgi:hypothetical protein
MSTKTADITPVRALLNSVIPIFLESQLPGRARLPLGFKALRPFPLAVPPLLCCADDTYVQMQSELINCLCKNDGHNPHKSPP